MLKKVYPLLGGAVILFSFFVLVFTSGTSVTSNALEGARGSGNILGYISLAVILGGFALLTFLKCREK